MTLKSMNVSMQMYGQLSLPQSRKQIYYEKDMATIAADPETQRWWKITDPMQSQVPEARSGEWWHVIPENFHVD
jgi:L-rhamnose mutarotase